MSLPDCDAPRMDAMDSVGFSHKSLLFKSTDTKHDLLLPSEVASVALADDS